MILQDISTLRLGLDYEAIFFDFDGVLADTEPVHFRCWRDLLAPRGIALTWDYYERECIGVADRAMLIRLGALADPPQAPEELFHLYPLKKQRFREACASESPVSEETRQAIQNLSYLPLGVVSSSGETEVVPILNRTWGKLFFGTTVFGGEVRNLKPSPDPYLLAAQRAAIRRALVFEDSSAGVESADKAGHHVFRVSSCAQLPEVLAKLVR